MILQQFSGGESSRLRPQFIQINEGAIYENIDNSVGTLVPVKSKLLTDINNAQYAYFYRAADKWVSFSIPTDFVEYRSTLYYTDGVQPSKFDGVNTYNLGIVKPSDTLTVAQTATTPLAITDITLGATSGGGDLPVSKTESYIFINSATLVQSRGLLVEFDPTEAVVTKKYTTEIRKRDDVEYTRTTIVTVDTRSITLSNPAGATIGSQGLKVYRLYDGEYRLVGTITTPSGSVVDNVADISANAILDTSLYGALQGEYQYQVTFYNSADGAESGPSTLTTVSDLYDTSELTGLPVSSDPQVDSIRIYRIGGLSTSSTLVATVSNGTTSYTDSTKDVDLQSTLLSDGVLIASAPPTSLTSLTEAYAMLFGVQGSKLRYTPIDNPNSWPELYFIDYADDITGIAPVATGLLIFTQFTTYLVTGTSPDTLTSQLLRDDQGCLSRQSIQTSRGSALWVSSDGICVSTGDDIQIVTKSKLGKISINPIDSILFDEEYYVLDSLGTIFVVDMRFELIFKRLSLGIQAFATAKDVLYGWSDSKTYELFASKESESMHFVSARMVEGSSSTRKNYKKVYFFSEGDIIIKLKIDNLLVVTYQLDTDIGITEVQIPQQYQRGSFIQFDISGTGELYEINFDAGAII